jgi:hypothetical protein
MQFPQPPLVVVVVVVVLLVVEVTQSHQKQSPLLGAVSLSWAASQGPAGGPGSQQQSLLEGGIHPAVTIH